ncbi:GNAT family N-acetyltransferase [Cupriavidus basilensis]
MFDFLVRRMTAADLPGVLRVWQAECYRSDLLEGTEAFASRLALARATCWVATSCNEHPHRPPTCSPIPGRKAVCSPSMACCAQSMHDDADAGDAHLVCPRHGCSPAGRGAGLGDAALGEGALRAALDAGLRHSWLIARNRRRAGGAGLGTRRSRRRLASPARTSSLATGLDAVMMERVLAR